VLPQVLFPGGNHEELHKTARVLCIPEQPPTASLPSAAATGARAAWPAEHDRGGCGALNDAGDVQG
jgi:hypothetical protein